MRLDQRMSVLSRSLHTHTHTHTPRWMNSRPPTLFHTTKSQLYFSLHVVMLKVSARPLKRGASRHLEAPHKSLQILVPGIQGSIVSLSGFMPSRWSRYLSHDVKPERPLQPSAPVSPHHSDCCMRLSPDRLAECMRDYSSKRSKGLVSRSHVHQLCAWLRKTQS